MIIGSPKTNPANSQSAIWTWNNHTNPATWPLSNTAFRYMPFLLEQLYKNNEAQIGRKLRTISEQAQAEAEKKWKCF